MIGWRAPSYAGDRRVAMCGTVEVGAIFPPLGSEKKWRWRLWGGAGSFAKEGTAPTELGAKVALDNAWAGFLNRAGLQEAAQ